MQLAIVKFTKLDMDIKFIDPVTEYSSCALRNQFLLWEEGFCSRNSHVHVYGDTVHLLMSSSESNPKAEARYKVHGFVF